MSGTMRAEIKLHGGPKDGGGDVMACDPWSGPPMRLFYWFSEIGRHSRIAPESMSIPAGSHIYHKGQRSVQGVYNYHYVGEYGGDADKGPGENCPA